MDVEPLVTWLRDTASRYAALERGRVEALRAQSALQAQLDELRQDHAALSAQVEQHAVVLRRPPSSPASPRRASPRKASVIGGGALSCSSLSPCSSKASLSDMSGFHCARLSFASSSHTEWDRERESRRSLSPRKAQALELVDENRAKPESSGQRKDASVESALQTGPVAVVCDPATPVRAAEHSAISDTSSLQQTTVRRMPLSPELRDICVDGLAEDASQVTRPAPFESTSTQPASAPAAPLAEAPAEGAVMAAFVVERTSFSPELRRVSPLSAELTKDCHSATYRSRVTSNQNRRVVSGAWSGPQHTAARSVERAISAERAVSERQSPCSAVNKVVGNAPRSFAAAAEASKRVTERVLPGRAARCDHGSDLGEQDTAQDTTPRSETTCRSETKDEASVPEPAVQVKVHTEEAREHRQVRSEVCTGKQSRASDLLSPSISPEKVPVSSPKAVIGAGPAHARSFDDDVATCKEWVELVTKKPCAQPFEDAITSGELLCELAIAILPTSVRRYNKDPKIPFKRLENLSTFIQACRSFGVMEYELFSTSDVEAGRGLAAVTRCLFALGRAIQTTCTSFAGPHLGNPDNSKRKLMRTTSGNLTAVSSPVPCVPQNWNGVQRVTVDSHNLDRGKWGRQAACATRIAPVAV